MASSKLNDQVTGVLTIAGSDPSSGAGVPLDLRVFFELGIYGFSVITAIIAQNSRGVQRIYKVDPHAVETQIDSVMSDFRVDACKIGMLFSHQVVSAVAERIRRRKLPRIILDPMILSKNGTPLVTPVARKRIETLLFPIAELITPNLPEAEQYLGKSIQSVSEMKEAAKILFDKGSRWVLVKGGHLEGNAVDVLYNGTDFFEFEGKRNPGISVHGTGCLLSSAITARLSLGDSMPEAVRFAKDFTFNAIERAQCLGKGSRLVTSFK